MTPLGLLLAVDHLARVVPGAALLSLAADLVGWAADTTADAATKAAEKLTGYAETARWIAHATRVAP